MYYAKSSWFLKTTALKELMIAENERINWQPPHIKHGRFGNWLANNVDWAISRERYWGSPINIWTNQNEPTSQICITSIKDLQEKGAYYESTGAAIPCGLDLHIPTIDDVVFKDESGNVYRRETGVLDCWFNAGVMPWGQFGYPAKPGSQENFQDQFPADFICEAIDQTRGWFYTLLAVSCLVAKRSSFKNVICTELILDIQGKKMSKSLGNVIDPIPLIDKFGADAVRWTFYSSNPWQVKKYSEDLPREALRSTFIPLWNCYSFFVTYASIDNWTPSRNAVVQLDELDRWILSAMRTLIKNVTIALDRYDVAQAAGELSKFTDSMSNWYIRRSRRRFWKSGGDEDKNAAYDTLHKILVSLSKVIAPLAPFLAETFYQNLVRQFDNDAPESVHLARWPTIEDFASEQELEEEMAIIQEAVSLSRSLRKQHDLKVRQPLSELLLTPVNSNLAERLERHLVSIAEEVNVKEVKIVKDYAEFVVISVKPNWKVLGPRFGDKIKMVVERIQNLSAIDVHNLSNGKQVSISLLGEVVQVEPADVTVEYNAKLGMVAQAGLGIAVAIRTNLTPALILEGNAREVVSIIQKLRKKSNFNITDKIGVRISCGDEIKNAINTHMKYIVSECLTSSVEFLPSLNGENFLVNGYNMSIVVQGSSEGT